MRISYAMRSILVAALNGLLVVGCNSGSSSPPSGPSREQTNLREARSNHTASRTTDDDVLVAGGRDAAGRPMRSTELVSPTGSREGPTLSVARAEHTATVLPSGKIVIAGGRSGFETLESTEIFDPTTGELSPGPDLPRPRAGHVAIASGERVIITGGVSIDPTSGEEQPDSETWVLDLGAGTVVALEGELQLSRGEAEEVLLQSGEFSLQAGSDGVELTFPASGPISIRDGEVRVGDVSVVTSGTTAVDIDDNEVTVNGERTEVRGATTSEGVIVAGGREGSVTVGKLELLQRTEDGFGEAITLAELAEARAGHTVTVSGDRILIIGGEDASGAPLALVEIIATAELTQVKTAQAQVSADQNGASVETSAGTVNADEEGADVELGGQATGSAPFIKKIKGGKKAGAKMNIIGNGFGGSGSGGRVRFTFRGNTLGTFVGNTRIQFFTPRKIRLKLGRDIRPGPYDIQVIDGRGRISNAVRINVRAR